MASNATIEAVIEAAGGPEHIHRGLVDFRRRFKLLDSRAPELVHAHPNEWVAMPEGDGLLFANSLEELLGKLRAAGKPTNTAAITFLDPNPRILIV